MNGLRYSWRECGDGPLLLLVHGGAAHSGWFQWMLPRLGRKYRTVAPDLRGHGHSGHADGYTWDEYSADLEKLVDLIAGDQPYYLAGHCSGAQIGLLMSARRVRPPAAIVGLELRLNFTPEEDAALRQFGRRERRYRDLAGLERSIRAYARRMRLPSDRAAVLRREVFREDIDGSWVALPDRRVLAQEQFRTWELAPLVTCPTHLVRGAESQQVSRIELLLMQGRLPFSTFEELPGLSHYMMVEDPDATCAVVEKFLDNIARRPLADVTGTAVGEAPHLNP